MSPVPFLFVGCILQATNSQGLYDKAEKDMLNRGRIANGPTKDDCDSFHSKLRDRSLFL